MIDDTWIIIEYNDCIIPLSSNRHDKMSWSEYFTKIYYRIIITFITIYIYMYYYKEFNGVSNDEEVVI